MELSATELTSQKLGLELPRSIFESCTILTDNQLLAGSMSYEALVHRLPLRSNLA